MTLQIATAMTIAGSDSSAGAGIQADLRTFQAFGVYATSAITAITAQNTLGITAIYPLPPTLVRQQIEAIMEDIAPPVWKTGMLALPETTHLVAECVRRYTPTALVVDPVLAAEQRSTPLLTHEALQLLIDELIPQATILTPNIREAEAITGFPITDRESMRQAARALHTLGAQIVVLKGGHLPSAHATDLVYDGQEFHELSTPRIETRNTHGSGCTFASAIAAGLAQGMPPLQAIQEAKAYITRALSESAELTIGHGNGPILSPLPPHLPRRR